MKEEKGKVVEKMNFMWLGLGRGRTSATEIKEQKHSMPNSRETRPVFKQSLRCN